MKNSNFAIYVVTLTLLLTCLSCRFLGISKGVEVKVVNNSKMPIEMIKVTTSERLTSLTKPRLAPDEEFDGFLSMRDNATDGTYIFQFIRAGKEEEVTQGYYTNGSPLDDAITFIVLDDTVEFEME